MCQQQVEVSLDPMSSSWYKCTFNIRFAVLAKQAFVLSMAKRSLRMVSLFLSPWETFLLLSLQAIHLLLHTKS